MNGENRILHGIADEKGGCINLGMVKIDFRIKKRIVRKGLDFIWDLIRKR